MKCSIPHNQKIEIVKQYAKEMNCRIFIETGTWQGDMVRGVKDCFEHIYSIELGMELYNRCCAEFKSFPNIHLYHGDSGKILPEILKDINEPCIFWLDAHYSMGNTVRGDVDTPIRQEIEVIMAHPIKNHCILIDDVKCFVGSQDYPTVEELCQLIIAEGSNVENLDDILRITFPFKSPTWEELPKQLKQEFLLGGRIKQEDWHIDEQTQPKHIYTVEEFKSYRERVQRRESLYYGATDKWLYEALNQFSIRDMDVAVIGSTIPWYEYIVLEFGGKPTTIEYNIPGYKNPEVNEISVEDYWNNPRQFDAAFSISSFEHDGLGRYGDPLNPNGDLWAMDDMKKVLKKDGLLFLSIPIGIDKIVWNAHRIYGSIRLPMLLYRWKIEGYFGMDESLMFRDTGTSGDYQPVVVLRNYGET